MERNACRWSALGSQRSGNRSAQDWRSTTIANTDHVEGLAESIGGSGLLYRVSRTLK